MPLTYEQQKALAMQWKAAEPALRKMLYAQIREEDNASVISDLAELTKFVVAQEPAPIPTGFVEMYRIFARQGKR